MMKDELEDVKQLVWSKDGVNVSSICTTSCLEPLAGANQSEAAAIGNHGSEPSMQIYCPFTRGLDRRHSSKLIASFVYAGPQRD